MGYLGNYKKKEIHLNIHVLQVVEKFPEFDFPDSRQQVLDFQKYCMNFRQNLPTKANCKMFIYKVIILLYLCK